ncbi:unnamed protein product [Danaus chrysippus]|uniref:(African queen) hypothetical protein n=1 Tax=Danaus chrysippus TaxID=151541 RepID=A0A8J2QTC2_9NEOP|nr:unnamed protein product [Danaus chrysippus]
MDFGDIIVLETEAARRVRDERRIHRRNLRDRSNPFDLGDEEFRIYFRVNKEIALILTRSLEGDIRRSRSHGLPVHIVILAAVRFYAVGSYQRCVGQDYNIVLAQRTVSKVVKEVSHAIVHRLLNVYIKFSSTTEERRAVASGFQAAHGLPDCLGCVDCTHIAIATPHNNDANDPPIGYPLPEPETSTEELTDHTIPTHTATSSSAALRRQQDIIMLIN